MPKITLARDWNDHHVPGQHTCYAKGETYVVAQDVLTRAQEAHAWAQADGQAGYLVDGEASAPGAAAPARRKRPSRARPAKSRPPAAPQP